jgi:phosphatidylglycerophosphate synthase
MAMGVVIGRERIPWGMAAGRAALGPVLAVGAECGWNGLAMAGLVVVALVSDIFDGVLARRWRCDTAGVRLFDTMADTVFYLCAAAALWIGQPGTVRAYAWRLGGLLGLEAVRLGFDLAKFGRPASYHSYLAKTWGLVMASGVVGLFAMRRGNWAFSCAMVVGVACQMEGLAMSLMLPVWRRDVKTLRAAWRLREEMKGALAVRATEGRRVLSAGA